MRYLFILFISFIAVAGKSQSAYEDSLRSYQQKYVQEHEVVSGEDKQLFRFYPVDPKWRVTARFEAVNDPKWFSMETSGAIKKVFRVYGIAHFMINDTSVQLYLYQSQNLMNVTQYKDLLFLPFTDLSSGIETYAAGRYLDLSLADIQNEQIVLDFNKAYNPYCAYVSGRYNCPIPPKENQLNVVIPAGEKNFEKLKIEK